MGAEPRLSLEWVDMCQCSSWRPFRGVAVGAEPRLSPESVDVWQCCSGRPFGGDVKMETLGCQDDSLIVSDIAAAWHEGK